MYYERQQRYNRNRLPNSYSQPTSTLLKGLLLTPFNSNPNPRNLLETHSSAERVQPNPALGQTRQNYRTYQSPDLREDPYSTKNQYYAPKTYRSPYLAQEYQPSYNYTGKQEPTHFPAKQDYPNFTHRYADKPDTKTHNPYFQAQKEYPTQQYPRRETLNKSNVARPRPRAVMPQCQQYNRYAIQERVGGRPARAEGRNTLTGNPNPYVKEDLGVSRKQEKRYDFRNNYR